MGQIQYSEKYADDAFEHRGMWLTLPKSQSFFPRTDFYLRMNGAQLVFNRAEDGFIMPSVTGVSLGDKIFELNPVTPSIGQSLTSCSSGGHLTTSSSMRLR